MDLGAVVHNHALAVRLAGGREVVAVVKADAYGHGAAAVARALESGGATRLAVLTVEEGAELRAAGVRLPILVMGGVHDRPEAEEACARDLVPVLHGEAPLPLLAAAAGRRARPLEVEIEVDMGMRRMGVPPQELEALALRVEDTPGMRLAGLYTHLACSEEPDLAPTRAQLRAFGALLDVLAARGIAPARVHVANSAGVLRSGELTSALPGAVNGVRPGLMLYGIRPARDLAPEVALRPVMSLRARVVAVRAVQKGEVVGYGGTWQAPRAGRIATLPLGYGDGIPWHLGGKGLVLLGGRRLPFAGRVSMDFVTVDVGDAPVEVGDEALFFGRASDGAGRLAVEEQAALAGTIPYELPTRVSPRVPRVLVSG